MHDTWDTPIGSLLSRAERAVKYGGSIQGGIQPSSTTPNVCIYSDPSRGEAYGYTFDGWEEDSGIYLYTGEGTSGPQTWTSRNRSILRHRDEQRALRLFVAEGYVPGTAAKNHRYVGRFEVDEELPYTVEEGPGQDKVLRPVFVFRLRPVGEVVERLQDRSRATELVTAARADLVPLESSTVTSFAVSGSVATTAQKREQALVKRYEARLVAMGHSVRRWKVTPPGQLRPLLTDPFDETANELYEAKGTATRDDVRYAIGQLFDYGRLVPSSGVKLTVLLPTRPSADLADLIKSVGFGCVYEESEGTFVRL